MKKIILLLSSAFFLLFIVYSVPKQSVQAQICSGSGTNTYIQYYCYPETFTQGCVSGDTTTTSTSYCSWINGYCQRESSSFGRRQTCQPDGSCDFSDSAGASYTYCTVTYPTNTPTPWPTATPVQTATPIPTSTPIPPTTPPDQPTNTPAPTLPTCQSPGQYCDTWTSPSSPFCVQVTYNASNNCSETYTPGGSCCGAVATPTTPPTLGGSCGAACTLSNQCSGDASWCNGGHCDGSACHGGPVSRGLRCDQFYAVSW
ncbi:hypothetical protein HGA88_06950, partial [Candidatus Roizmanbacteria bacterium]|nr:hypothetical protein [Candidatus Roizmanbacteria bacterium]